MKTNYTIDPKRSIPKWKIDKIFALSQLHKYQHPMLSSRGKMCSMGGMACYSKIARIVKVNPTTVRNHLIGNHKLVQERISKYRKTPIGRMRRRKWERKHYSVNKRKRWVKK